MDAAIQVVAGVLTDESGRVLLAQRPPGKHLAGLWEFPGGKVEPGEDAAAALVRELDEELGIDARVGRSLIVVPHGRIVLDVREVVDWSGTPSSREGQALSWSLPAAIDGAHVTPADRPVLAALRLPARYLITPAGIDADALVDGVERALRAGVRLVQLRLPDAPRSRVATIARELREHCALYGAHLLLNADWELAEVLGLDGVHLPARVARRLASRPLPTHRWVSVSCHDRDELAHAARIGADFVTLSPVAATTSHPHAQPIGWETATRLIARSALPVYMMGGMREHDIVRAHDAGAQGIAAIRALWRD